MLLAFILETFIQLGRDYIKIEVLNDHSSYSGTWIEYISLQPINTFLISPLIFLIGILIPYNIIIIYFGLIKSKYIIKVGLLLLIMIIVLCLLGTFMNVWFFPLWKNIYYIFYFIPYSFLFAGLIHWLVDRKEVKE